MTMHIHNDGLDEALPSGSRTKILAAVGAIDKAPIATLVDTSNLAVHAVFVAMTFRDGATGSTSKSHWILISMLVSFASLFAAAIGAEAILNGGTRGIMFMVMTCLPSFFLVGITSQMCSDQLSYVREQLATLSKPGTDAESLHSVHATTQKALRRWSFFLHTEFVLTLATILIFLKGDAERHGEKSVSEDDLTQRTTPFVVTCVVTLLVQLVSVARYNDGIDQLRKKAALDNCSTWVMLTGSGIKLRIFWTELGTNKY
eukprot:UN3394